jgi:hypothetical protein
MRSMHHTEFSRDAGSSKSSLDYCSTDAARILAFSIIFIETLELKDLHTSRELILQIRDLHKITTAAG